MAPTQTATYLLDGGNPFLRNSEDQAVLAQLKLSIKLSMLIDARGVMAVGAITLPVQLVSSNFRTSG